MDHTLTATFLASLMAQMVSLLSACNAICLQCKRSGSIPACGRYPGEGTSNSLQYYCLENSMNRGAWWAIVQDWVINTLPGRKINHNEEGIMSAFKQIVELDFEKGKSGSMKVVWFGRKINGDHISELNWRYIFSKISFLWFLRARSRLDIKNVVIAKTSG